MIRVVAVTSLVLLLAMVLYLPAARPAAAFMAQVRNEHAVLREYWGRGHAQAILERMLELQRALTPAPPLMPVAHAAVKGSDKVSTEVAAVGSRLITSGYLRALNALFVLTTYRVAVLLHLLPGVAPFLVAALIDGLIKRAVKGQDFSGHNPEIFSACVCGTILAACTLVLLCAIPSQLPPALLPALLFAVGVFTNIGVANYHKRL